jgi:dephospho-CoA kinase
MLSVGLTGGLASGKSFVGSQLAALGCVLIKADNLGHAVLEPGAEAYQEVIDEFGASILNPDSTIDRRRLASLVFDHPDRLDKLNSIVHPQVRARARALADEASARDPSAIIVTEAAILIETGSYRNYDRLIVAVCTDQQQIERAMHRDGITRDEALARLRCQLPLSEKVKLADFVIDTSGPKENTTAQTRVVYEALRSING